MSKGKRRGKPGQRKGDTHYTPPKPLVVAPPNDPPKPPDVQAGDSNEGDNDTQELTEAVDRHVRMNTWFAGAIMVATVMQAVVSCFQWKSMDRSLSQTDTVIALMAGEQRAWIDFGAPELSVNRLGEAQVVVPLANSGKSPATIVFWSFGIFTSEGDIDDIEKAFHYDDIDPDDTPRWAMRVSPGDTIYPSERIENSNESLISEIRSGKQKAVVFGWIVYEDKFRRYPPTRWCFWFDEATGKFQPDYSFHMLPDYQYDDDGNITNPQ